MVFYSLKKRITSLIKIIIIFQKYLLLTSCIANDISGFMNKNIIMIKRNIILLGLLSGVFTSCVGVKPIASEYEIFYERSKRDSRVRTRKW